MQKRAKWQRRAAAGYGHARRSGAFALSGSGAHVTLAPHRIRHPETDEHRREQSPGGGHATTAGRHKSADEMTLPSALQSGSTRHGARTGGPIQTAAGVCAIGEATCDGR